MEKIWLGIGLTANLLFAGRFLVQWLASERAGRSKFPIAFWYLSLSGAALLLAYAIFRRDPVFILSQSMGMIIYLRNLMLLKKESGPA